MSISTADGVAYTRDGRMRISQTGALETLNGDAVLDAGGAPIILNPAAGAPTIAGDGMIAQDGKQVGAIGLFAIDDDAKLTRTENSGVIPDKPATPILDFTRNGIVQGFVESANVNPIQEMTKLITVTRDFRRRQLANVANGIVAARRHQDARHGRLSKACNRRSILGLAHERG